MPPASAQLQAAQEDVVVSREHGQPGYRAELGIIGLLDREHVLDLGQCLELGRRDIDHRAPGDVVEHDRLVGRRRNGLNVSSHAGRIRLVVVGRHDQHRVGAGPVGLARQVHGMAGVVGAAAADQRNALPDLGSDGSQQRDLLTVVERGRLPGAAGDHEAVGPVLEQVDRQPAGRGEVHVAIPVERGRHGGQVAAELNHGPLG